MRTWSPSFFQENSKADRDNGILLLMAGDVESNPGPDNSKKVTNGTGKQNLMEVITFNCRGLKDYKKLKRILNTCANIINKNRSS
jgi:hypothetical protein